MPSQSNPSRACVSYSTRSPATVMTGNPTHTRFQLSEILLAIKNHIEPAARKKSLVCRTLLTNQVPNCLQGDPLALFMRLQDMALEQIEACSSHSVQIIIDVLEFEAAGVVLRFSIVASKRRDHRLPCGTAPVSTGWSQKRNSSSSQAIAGNGNEAHRSSNRHLAFDQYFPVCTQCESNRSPCRCVPGTLKVNIPTMLEEPDMNDRFATIPAEIDATLETLLHQVGNEAVEELISKSLTYLETIQHNLTDSLKAGEWPTVARQAHQLKGAAAIYGNSALTALVKKLQQKPAPQANSQVLIEELEQILDIVRETLHEKRQQLQRR